ncbi:MAG TPA: hypothetical protein VHX38_41230 [Pseudonocardiaceae bacterium]|jgi:hypothetical protein|nr:hypothetical protein [Pseudonocardiaceae bacterium]
MSRNRYTTLIRKDQRAQLAAQEKALEILARELYGQAVSPVELPVADDRKPHRQARLEQKRRRRAAQRPDRSTKSQTHSVSQPTKDNKEGITHVSAA